MHLIEAVNVCDALPKAVHYLMVYGKKEQTRIGEARVSPVPVCIWYSRPKEHVLRNTIRDANPFFHLMEAMWMLAGREDGAYLDNYISTFSKDFGVGGIIPDAYGFRWRYGLEFDQLHEIIKQLRNNHQTRQCVLQMWGAGRHDLLADVARPCNLVCTFRVREGELDMTVFNRSNDLIWGCCGANAVHFAILLEYVAGMVGLPMGYYWHITTNLHLYEEHITMFRKRITTSLDLTVEVNLGYHLNHGFRHYENTQPLIVFPDSFDEELQETMLFIDELHKGEQGYDGNIGNPFLREVVIPMATAHRFYKTHHMAEAYEEIHQVTAADWRVAGIEWLERHDGQRRSGSKT